MIVFVKGKEYYYIAFVGKITNIPKLKCNQFSVNYVIGTAKWTLAAKGSIKKRLFKGNIDGE